MLDILIFSRNSINWQFDTNTQCQMTHLTIQNHWNPMYVAPCSLATARRKYMYVTACKRSYINRKIISYKRWHTMNDTMIQWSWILCKLVILLHFISWKNSLSDISRKCIIPYTINRANLSQFTQKMIANAVSRLLSSLVWIDSG